MPTIQDRFVMRRGLAANLASVNEIPLQGEWILALDAADDAHRLKIGDGVTHYNDLPFIGLGGGGGSSGVVRPAGTAYTPVLADDGNTIISGSATAFTLTLPANATVAFPIGAKIAYTQGAAGAVTIAAATGVTLHAPNGTATGAQYDGGVAEKIGTDEWQLWNPVAIGEAPIDGKTYGRKDGAWAETTGGAGGGGITGINEQTGTAYTLALTDATQAVRCTNAAAITLTIPANATIAMPLYCTIPIIQGAAGAVTIAGAAGVTLESPNGTATAAAGDFRTLFQRAANVWVIG